MTETKPNILVIEDEPNLRDGLKHNLELDGYDVDTAATGTEGLSKAMQNGHTLILLDLMLPEVDGIEILRQLRSSGSNTPVIIISTEGRETDQKRAGDHHLCQGHGSREGHRTRTRG